MGIEVSGSLKIRGNYTVKLDMTEKEFDALSEQKQNEAISDAIDWREWLNNSDVDDIDVDNIE